MVKNVLVTGGAGFIGAHFILHILERYNDIRIVNLDALTYAADLANLKSIEKEERYTFIKGTICDYDKVVTIIKKYHIDTIVNFAAESHVDRAINDAKVFAQTNIMGTLTLLKAAQGIWEGEFEGKTFIQISTDEVYGSAGAENAFSENSLLSPRNPYAASKASADMLCLAWSTTYNFPVSITRSSNNFGSFQHQEKFIPQVIYKALNNEPVPIYGDGQNVRDWLSVYDNVRAIEAVIAKGKAGEIYNISAHNEIENINLAKKIIDIINLETKLDVPYNLLTFVKDRPGHDFRYAMITDKIENEIGWFAEKEFYKVLRQTVRWYLIHMCRRY